MISVALASYNGHQFIRDQIKSILLNLGNADELIISDDCSTDGTAEIINEFALLDSRVKVLGNEHRIGVVKNFERALDACSGDYIFLADQDDIWLPEKVAIVMDRFLQSGADCILHDVMVTDSSLNIIHSSYFELRRVRRGLWANILKNSYMGNAMAFKSSILDAATPFPDRIPMHDQWIGLISELYGKVEFIDRPLGCYRRHNCNVTEMRHGSFLAMLRKRFWLCIAVMPKLIDKMICD